MLFDTHAHMDDRAFQEDRDIILEGLAEKGVAFSIIGSALLFATMHGSVGMLIMQFFVGLAIAIVVTITKNHLYGVAMHLFYNMFISVIFALPEIAGDLLPQLKFTVSAFVFLFGVVFLIISGYYFLKKFMARYKAEILGVKKQKSAYEKSPVVCYSFVNTCDSEYYLKDFDSLDKDLLKNNNTVFLCSDEFCKLNKKSNSKLTYLLFALALCLSVALIFI